MSDLISRSELIKTLRDKASENAIMGYLTAYDITNSIIEDVEEQPTAYNVDNVVEELEQRSKEYNSGVRLHGKPEEMLTDDAIEIVKQSSVVDDVCEYKIKDEIIYASCNNKSIASAFCWFNECGDYKYCPYCGKKIKVVE